MPITDQWIVAPDGIRLAATIYLPDGDGPWPALLEALPYRKDDMTLDYGAEYIRLADEGRFGVARVDIRGTGSSEGLAIDEYPASELDDLVQVIEWLADQSWCTGAVGMFGTSYSGFNSLQVACRQPPALKAVIACYATDDRYTDDVHYSGGVLQALDLLDYCHYMNAMNALPPVPALFGEGWRDQWLQRLEGLQPWLLRWMEEQTDGPYWRHGSLRLGTRPADSTEGYERITAATMLVGGWADGYRNNTLRTMARLQCPKRLLLGPWSHMSTARSLPGPNIDLVPEMIRWFNQHLRGATADDQPSMLIYVRRPVTPQPDLVTQDGFWRYEEKWPADRAVKLQLAASGDGIDRLQIRPDTGWTAWIWCAGALPYGQPIDQRLDHTYSLVYDLETLDSEQEILGYPQVRLRIKVDAPVAFLSAKLCDVFPDGTVALVSRDLFNLTHRHSSLEPAAVNPDEWLELEVELDATSWVYQPGHTIRLAIAGGDWPNNWPAPSLNVLEIDRASLVLELPVIATTPSGDPPPHFPAPDQNEKKEDQVTWTITHDILGRSTTTVVEQSSNYDGKYESKCHEKHWGELGVSLDRPGIAWAKATTRYDMTWPEVEVSVQANLVIVSDPESYQVDITISAQEDGNQIFDKSWSSAIARRLQ